MRVSRSLTHRALSSGSRSRTTSAPHRARRRRVSCGRRRRPAARSPRGLRGGEGRHLRASFHSGPMPRSSHDNGVDISGPTVTGSRHARRHDLRGPARRLGPRPITDPDVFEGVVDLIVAEQARCRGLDLRLAVPRRRPAHAADLPARRASHRRCRPRAGWSDTAVHGGCRQRRARRGHGHRPAGAAVPTPRDHDLRGAFEAPAARPVCACWASPSLRPRRVTAFPADGPVAA